MNIKDKIQLYRDLYDGMDEVLKELDPCQITIVDGKTVCNGTKNNHRESNTLCCSNCMHLSKSGCRVKSLACKTWLCGDAIKYMMDNFEEANIVLLLGYKKYIELKAAHHNIPMHFRTSLTTNFNLLKKGW